MSRTEGPESIAIANALIQLENLGANEYVITFGPDGRQFCATPNGYTASFLPKRVIAKLSSGGVKKILWASFGSSKYSWFVAYELRDGNLDFELGQAIPHALRDFVEQISQSNHLLRSLRVQFGNRDAFVAWTQTVWACFSIPSPLQLKLRQLSSAVLEGSGGLRGSFRSGTIDNVQWHHDGSFYVKSDTRHIWSYEASILSGAWDKLWQNAAGDQLKSKIQNELAYVIIDPHGSSGDSFAFFKKQQPGQEVPFVLHFGQECVHTNLQKPTGKLVMKPKEESEERPKQRSKQKPKEKPKEDPKQLEHWQLASQEADEPHYQWAVSKRSGQPHPTEAWELKLQKGERVQILHDMGRDWFIGLGTENIKGWVHRSWLSFGNRKPHAKPKNAYAKFQDDLQTLMVPGRLCRFLSMKDYIDTCANASCQLLKDDPSSLGVYAHDLKLLLEGSGGYTYEWLKEGRNMWHPDRFTRFCHVDHVQHLRPLAEQMFVLYTILMETCKA